MAAERNGVSVAANVGGFRLRQLSPKDSFLQKDDVVLDMQQVAVSV